MVVAHAIRSMGVPPIPNCHRRNAVYYWRRWPPGFLRALLQVSLGVKEPRTVRSLSLMLTAKSEELFPRYRAGQMVAHNWRAFGHAPGLLDVFDGAGGSLSAIKQIQPEANYRR